jgi:hypothetical protein
MSVAGRRLANPETLVRQPWVMYAACLGRHYLLGLCQFHHVLLRIFLTRTALYGPTSINGLAVKKRAEAPSHTRGPRPSDV